MTGRHRVSGLLLVLLVSVNALNDPVLRRLERDLGQLTQDVSKSETTDSMLATSSEAEQKQSRRVEKWMENERLRESMLATMNKLKGPGGQGQGRGDKRKTKQQVAEETAVKCPEGTSSCEKCQALDDTISSINNNLLKMGEAVLSKDQQQYTDARILEVKKQIKELDKKIEDKTKKEPFFKSIVSKAAGALGKYVGGLVGLGELGSKAFTWLAEKGYNYFAPKEKPEKLLEDTLLAQLSQENGELLVIAATLNTLEQAMLFRYRGYTPQDFLDNERYPFKAIYASGSATKKGDIMEFLQKLSHDSATESWRTRCVKIAQGKGIKGDTISKILVEVDAFKTSIYDVFGITGEESSKNVLTIFASLSRYLTYVRTAASTFAVTWTPTKVEVTTLALVGNPMCDSKCFNKYFYARVPKQIASSIDLFEDSYTPIALVTIRKMVGCNTRPMYEGWYTDHRPTIKFQYWLDRAEVIALLPAMNSLNIAPIRVSSDRLGEDNPSMIWPLSGQVPASGLATVEYLTDFDRNFIPAKGPKATGKEECKGDGIPLDCNKWYMYPQSTTECRGGVSMLASFMGILKAKKYNPFNQHLEGCGLTEKQAKEKDMASAGETAYRPTLRGQNDNGFPRFNNNNNGFPSFNNQPTYEEKYGSKATTCEIPPWIANTATACTHCH
eukprot:comp20678_c0_seq1/m.42303 comp20678_c0_seq1/g.42303  ORF comp20678_c0_seq1/g.42303 comp20678_c0_seq1/m.42303 type:complete len:670 (-) comp20678_c0_seq1:181-2190(-)